MCQSPTQLAVGKQLLGSVRVCSIWLFFAGLVHAHSGRQSHHSLCSDPSGICFMLETRTVLSEPTSFWLKCLELEPVSLSDKKHLYWFTLALAKPQSSFCSHYHYSGAV